MRRNWSVSQYTEIPNVKLLGAWNLKQTITLFILLHSTVIYWWYIQNSSLKYNHTLLNNDKSVLHCQNCESWTVSEYKGPDSARNYIYMLLTDRNTFSKECISFEIGSLAMVMDRKCVFSKFIYIYIFFPIQKEETCQM